MKFLNRKEPGYKSIGLCWEDKPWARKGIEFILCTPELQDSQYPFRFVFQMKWGPGAGYIGGRTAFFAWRCKDRRSYRSINKRTPIQIGLTDNANLVPYVY